MIAERRFKGSEPQVRKVKWNVELRTWLTMFVSDFNFPIIISAFSSLRDLNSCIDVLGVGYIRKYHRIWMEIRKIIGCALPIFPSLHLYISGKFTSYAGKITYSSSFGGWLPRGIWSFSVSDKSCCVVLGCQMSLLILTCLPVSSSALQMWRPNCAKKIINRANRWKGKGRWAQRQIIDYLFNLFGPPSKSGVAPGPPGMSGKTSHVMTGHRSTIKVHLNYLIRNPVMNLGLCWLIYPILSYPRFINPWIDSWTRFGS